MLVALTVALQRPVVGLQRLAEQGRPLIRVVGLHGDVVLERVPTICGRESQGRVVHAVGTTNLDPHCIELLQGVGLRLVRHPIGIGYPHGHGVLEFIEQ